MKKISQFLLLLFISVINYAQNTETVNNITKYWNYRNRLTQNFIAIGGKSGESMPFGTRNERGNPHLSLGEAPIMLGQYIGVLATEYKLLKQNNQNTEQTLKELYYALYAFNRLDLVAETVNGYNKKPKLDGYYVREDIPNDFVSSHPELNKNSIESYQFIYGSGKPFTVKCTTHKGNSCCDVTVSRDCKVNENPKGYAKKYNHVPMSMDQSLGILIGVSLVNKLVDGTVNYQNLAFQDKETSIKKEAQNIAKRILTYAQKHHWTPKEPDGDYIGDCDFRTNAKPNFFKNNVTMLVFGRFFSKIGKNIFGEKLAFTPFIGFLNGVGSIQADNFKGDFWNRRMYIEMMTLSNKNNHLWLSAARKVKNASEKYDWQPLYYNMGIILHDWKKDSKIKKQSLEMLSSAPYNGPYYHKINDFAKNGWATKNRFSASLGEQYNGSRFPEINGNYSGLDYMLLHNMYLLNSNNTSDFKNFTVDKSSKITIKNIKLKPKKCVQQKLQSCKERKKYYIFLDGFIRKRCKKTDDCTKISATYFHKKFGEFNGPNMQCKKAVFKKECAE